MGIMRGVKATTRKAPAARKKKAPARKKAPAAKQAPAAKKQAPAARKAKVTAKKPPAKHGPRADFGAPVEVFFAKQPPPLRAILDELRKLVEAAAPDAASSIKWGMPFYSIDGSMVVALGAHKSHVNLILAGPPGAFSDPKGLLSGEAKMGRHLKVTSLETLPRTAIRGWLKTAVQHARK